jgi:hypothetical protein
VLTGNRTRSKTQTAEIEADKPFLFFLAALASAAYLVYRLVHFSNRKRPVPKPEPVVG